MGRHEVHSMNTYYSAERRLIKTDKLISIMMSPTKQQIKKLPNFSFLIETTRVSTPVECLNSSPAQQAGKLWPSANMSHNFRSKESKKSIMGSNDLNYGQVSNKTLSQKMGH